MPEDDFQALCLYNAESQGILQGIESTGGDLDLAKVTLFPCVVPDRGVSDRTMEAALTTLNEIVERVRSSQKKPWWKFW